MDETTLKLLKVIEDKDIGNRLEGFNTCTRVLLERINYNLVSGQVSSGEDMVGSYEKTTDKLVIIVDLLESNLNQ